MATVHTEYGPGRIIDRETVRGRTRCKVAGDGFEVWLDQAKLGGMSDDYDTDYDADGGDTHEPQDVHRLRHKLRADDDYSDDDDPARYSRRVAWAPLDRDNSTELPYDPEPQHNAIGTHGDDDSSTIQPIHHIDPDERLRPSDSISFKSGDDDGYPGPDADLFAKQGAVEKEALFGLMYFQQNRDRLQKALHFALGPQRGEIALRGIEGHVIGSSYGNLAEGLNNQASQAANWASPGGPQGGYGQMIHNSSRHLSGPELALIAPIIRSVLPSAASALLGGGGGGVGGALEDAMGEGNDFGPGEGYGDMIQANHRPSGLSDRYIDLTASVDHHSDPVAQFRHDPAAYINRVGHLMDEGLNPRFAEYMELVDGDRGVRTAAWKDVRKKAMRLKREGHVTVKDIAPNRIMASVVGDHGTYDVVILKGSSFGGLNNGYGGHSISNWHCACEWGKWAFRRKYTYVGRLCSHAYASYLTMQSAHMTGKPRQTKLPQRKKPSRALPNPFVKRSDALQNGPERLTPDMVVNDTDDAHIFLDVEKDERTDTGPDAVVSDKDIVHFARVMAECERTERPYPRQLVAFLSRYSGCGCPDDDTPSDYEAHDSGDADAAVDRLRGFADDDVEDDFGHMADRVDEIQDAVEEARYNGVDASQFVAMVRSAAGEDDEDRGTTRQVAQDGTTTTTTPSNAADNIRADNEGDGSQLFFPGTSAAPGQAFVDKLQQMTQQSQNPNNNGVSNSGAKAPTPAAPAASGAYTAPGGGMTQGTVSDGGVAGAENGNNSAITSDSLAGGKYKVQKGDTLSDIAQRSYGDMNKYQDLAKANGITNPDVLTEGQEIDIADPTGNGGMSGNITNPAGSTKAVNGPAVDGAMPKDTVGSAAAEGVNAGASIGSAAGDAPLAAEAPAPPPAQPAQTSAEKPATIVQSRRTARDWLRWAAEGDGTAGEASPSASDQAAGATSATAPSPGAAPATNPATEQAAPNKKDDTLDPNDPAQLDEQQQAMPGQQPASTTPPTTGLGLGGGMGGGMDMGGIGDALSTGVGAASNIASGIGGAIPGIGSAISGIASGLGSIFSSRQDAEDWRRYAYPTADGEGDLEPHTHPFAGSGWAGPLEIGTSEEYADEARKKHDDVTDLGDDPLSTPMGEWQKQSALDADEDDDSGYRDGVREMRGKPWKGDWQGQMAPGDDGDHGNHHKSGSFDADDDSSDIVRAFQANLGDTALGAGAGGGSGRFDDISGAAAGFLRTAGRNYSMAEQSELIREGDKGGAGNLGDLDLRGTHYEDMTTLGW